ncbi:alpha/beta hydrolase [Pseudomonas sp.]|uniref:alpha/beta hydrolase n=1 Tax=Pseudomonas sp. TaxID=306 RepID=UPI003D0F64D2
MRRWACGLLALLPALAGAAPGAKPGWAEATLPYAEQRDITSRQGRHYRIFLSRPQLPPPAGGYPVLYVLDGNALFPLLAMQARALEMRVAVNGAEPVLVVGIGYPGDALYDVAARAEDYTPPTADLGASGDRLSAARGGAERFLDFIESELKPLVQARYPVDRSRQTLFGHSYGGLFTLYTLFNRPASFQAYIAASPSLWWGKGAIFDDLQRFSDSRQVLDARLYLAAGGAEQPRGDAEPGTLRQRHLAERRMLDNLRQLAGRLEPLRERGLASELHVLAGENHGSSAIVVSTRALPFALGKGPLEP